MRVKLEEVCERGSSNLAQKDLEGLHGDYPVYGASGYLKNIDSYHQENEYIAVVKDGAGIGRTMLLPPKSSVIGTLQYLIPKDNINTKYLYYAVKSMNLARYYTGATIPHIYFKDYKKETLPLPDESVQIEIVDKLEKVEKIIGYRKQQLLELDKLIKSRFVERFGDKSKYKLAPLIDNVEEMFIGPFGSSLKNECFVSQEDAYCMVYEQKHAIRKTMEVETRYVNQAKYNELKRFTVFGGDIIVSCRGTIGEVFAVPDDAPLGIMHPSIMKIRLKKDVYQKEFFIFTLADYMEQQNTRANGSGIKMAVTATTLGKEEFIVPTLEEQNEFVNFKQQVDKQKVILQQSLTELETQFQALMQEAFKA